MRIFFDIFRSFRDIWKILRYLEKYTAFLAVFQLFLAISVLSFYARGSEWCFKNHGCRKIFAEIHGSHSLVFFSGCARFAAVSFFFLNLSRRIDFFKTKKAAKYRLVKILYIYELG